MAKKQSDPIDIALRIGIEAYEMLRGGMSEAAVRKRLGEIKHDLNRELNKNVERIRERERQRR